MTKIGGFFARKSGLYDKPAEPAPEPTTASDNPLEIDEELFSALGSQTGGDNEALRNLLLDATTKIDELEGIKAAVVRLVDPVGKTMRALEAERSEKTGLQAVLNNTRTAYGKLRNEVADLEKKASVADKECRQLRQELAATQMQLRSAEQTRHDIAIDVAARRAQIADLETRLAQECGESSNLREECRRLDERLSAADKRVIALESELNAARQRLLVAEDEKRAQQVSLDKASAETARIARRLAETEGALNAAQGRLRHVEGNYAELSTEHGRLANAFEEAKERHEHELTSLQMRNEALTARSAASDKLLTEAREHLLGRAEEIRDYDRRTGELAGERDTLLTRLAEIEAERLKRQSEFEETDRVRAALLDRNNALARAFNAKETALARAEETIAEFKTQVAALEQTIASDRQTAEQATEELTAALRREKMERAVVEGALETARKDFARLMRDVMALQRGQQERDVAQVSEPRAANAA